MCVFVIMIMTLLQCELYHWIDVLDRFDGILLEAASRDDSALDGSTNTDCIFLCSKMSDPQVVCVPHVLSFGYRMQKCACELNTAHSLQFKEKVLVVLNFTALLIEHSYARHIYNSTEVSNCLITVVVVDNDIIVMIFYFVCSICVSC